MREKLRNGVIAVAFAVFLAVGFWQTCFQVTNEIGPLGADKDRRQVLIQSLDAYFAGWTDSWQRMFQEPMRTTFKLSYRLTDPSREPDSLLVDRILHSRASEFLDLYRGPASLQRDWQVPVEKLRARADSLKVKTFGELLDAYGFRTFRIDLEGKRWVFR